MKAVLISIQPEWSGKIANRQKTVEVRKSQPNLNPPFRCYIYCSLPKTKGPHQILEIHGTDGKIRKANGKVIGEFICDKIAMSIPGYKDHVAAYWDLLDGSCLSADELMDYGQWKILYGWHISNLYVYDKPLELSDFMKLCPNDLFCEVCAMYSEFEERCGNGTLAIKRAPQSWCYVEER